MFAKRFPWLLALFALLLIQQLGLGHRYEHAGASSAFVASEHAAQSTLAQGEAGSLPEHGEGICGLLDHLCVGDLLWLAPALPACGQLALALVFFLAVGFNPRWTAAFQARGPPSGN